MSSSDPDPLRPAALDGLLDHERNRGDGAVERAAVAQGWAPRERLAEALAELAELREAGESVSLPELLLRRSLVDPDRLARLLADSGLGLRLCRPCLRVAEARCPKCGRELEGASKEAAGARIGKYSVVREIARGGMGVVYEAQDPALRRRVALKVLLEDKADSRLVARLHREAAVAAQLRHPNIVGVHEVATAEDESGRVVHFIAMDYVEGGTLADEIASGRRNRRDLLRMLEEVARAAGFAHAACVIHRDLKPSNILVDASGRALLTDFGLARAENFATRLTRSNAVMGTPQYMAPEQVLGKSGEIDARSDVYALGIVLYEILTGRTPFHGETEARLYVEILEKDPAPPRSVNPAVSPELEAVCLKAVEKEPGRRYANGTEFADDLTRFLRGEAVRARSPSTWSRLARRIRRNRGISVALLAIVMLLLAGAAIVGAIRNRSRRQLDEQREAQLRLSAIWGTITERKREVRQLRVPAEQARGELAQAVARADAFIAERPSEPQGYYVRARGRAYLGNLDGAEEDARTALSLRPDFRPAWSLLGLLAMERYQRLIVLVDSTDDRADELSEILAGALDAFGRGWTAESERGDSERWGLAWQREDQIALRLAEAARLTYRERKPAEACGLLKRLMEREFQAEEYARWIGVWEGSIAWLDTAVRLAPGYAEALVDRGNLKYRAGDFAAAVRDYDLALSVQPDSADACNNRGIARLARDDPRGAFADFDRAVRLRPNYWGSYLNRGNALRAMGDAKGAIEDYGRAIAMRPSGPNAFFSRGRAKAMLADWRGAVSDYDRAIELRDGYAPAYYWRGNAKNALGDVDGAIADYGRAVERKPDYVEAYLNRGNARATRREYDAAIADYDRAIDLKKDYANAYAARGVVRRYLGRHAEAIADLDRAIELRKDWPDAHFDRALARAMQGDVPGAIRDLDRAIELRKDFAEAWLQRGAMKKAGGDFRGAVSDLEEALRLTPPESPARAQVLRELEEARRGR
ncbi:MAG: tetratricopeptide repeat protein [Planctomycetes bacterium]|nr:tetratricopeptide repeat protein [Planctomycetota bacterium]